MNRITKGIFAILLLTSALSACSTGIALPKAGCWMLLERKSLSGADYSNAVPGFINLSVANNQLIIQRTVPGAHGDTTTVDTVFANGTPRYSVSPQGRKYSLIISLEKDDQFTLTKNYDSPDGKIKGEISSVENWQFDEENHRLILHRTYHKKGEDPWEMQGSYISAPADAFGKERGIRFDESSDWEAIKAAAKKENKYIFVDCFATWCGPCKVMDKEVYPLNITGDQLNEDFISVKLQFDSTKNDNEVVRKRFPMVREFTEKYHIGAFPSFLFFSPNGELVHKGLGQQSPAAFIQIAQNARNPQKQYVALEKQFKAGTLKDYPAMAYLAYTAKIFDDKVFANEAAKIYIRDYLNKLPAEKFMTRENLEFANDFEGLTLPQDAFFKACYEKPILVDSLLGSKETGYYTVYNTIIRRELDDKVAPNRKPLPGNPDWAELEAAIRTKYPKMDVHKIILNEQIFYYQALKKDQVCVKYFVEKVQKYGVGEAGGCNGIAGIMLQFCNNRDTLLMAAKWMKDALEKKAENDPKWLPGDYGNLGAVLYKAGNNVEGISYLQKHIHWFMDIAKMNGENIELAKKSESYLQKSSYLKRMQAGEKIDTWDMRWIM